MTKVNFMQLSAKQIGERLRQLRKSAGLSQQEVCKQLQLSQSSYSRIELGAQRPTDAQLLAFLERINLSVEAFLSDETFAPKIVGAACAGFPTDRYPDDLGTLSDIVPTHEHIFIVQVSGYSMEPTINNGDFVIVDSLQKDPQDLRNQIVCARVEDEEHVIKRLVYETGCYYLKSDNPQFPLIPVRADTEIEGKVTNIIKRL